MRRKSLGLLSLLVTTTISPLAGAGNPLVETPANYAGAPAHAYAEMTSEVCLQMLEDRAIAYERATAGPLVDAPVLLTGPLREVHFRHVHARANGAVMDCRLVLALDDFAQVLREQGVVEVGYLAAYRPDPSGMAKEGQRHPAALAMDIAWFQRDDGKKLVVERDFQGRVGARTCGRRAQQPDSDNESARALRKLVCDTGKARLFHLVLTPNYDPEHRNHVHVEVRRGVRWFLVQ
jgi:hypothetical protein